MKRLLVVFAVALLFGATACKKTCTCVTKVDGVEMSTAEVDRDGKKCSDMDSKVDLLGVTTEISCK